MTQSKFPIMFGLCLIVTIPGRAFAGKVPQGNLILATGTSLERGDDPMQKLTQGLEWELRQRGYDGEIRIADNLPDSASSDDNLVALTLIKSHWITKKAFSLPYLLNRFKREFSVEMELGLCSISQEKSFERIRASRETPIQAQLLSNDEYDPDLFPDQSRRLEIEEKAYADIIKIIADRLGARLK